MSAVVCGSKRSFFEDLPSNSPSPVSKRLRCSSSTSPARFSVSSSLGHLRGLFPLMDSQLLERALEECGYDLDATIKHLNKLGLGSAEEKSGTLEHSDGNVERGTLSNEEASPAARNPSVLNNLPADGAEWVNLLVGEMMSATSVDDARARATRVLEALEKSISESAGAEAAQTFEKETMLLKEQIEVLIRDNTILKRAVSIQHERQKENEVRDQELQHLKQLVSQYQEQLRTLEVNNYTLTMHLRQAQQSNPMPGHFHPDIF